MLMWNRYHESRAFSGHGARLLAAPLSPRNEPGLLITHAAPLSPRNEFHGNEGDLRAIRRKSCSAGLALGVAEAAVPRRGTSERLDHDVSSLPCVSTCGDSGANLVVNNPGSFRRNRGGDDGRDESTGDADFANALLVDDFGNAALPCFVATSRKANSLVSKSRLAALASLRSTTGVFPSALYPRSRSRTTAEATARGAAAHTSSTAADTARGGAATSLAPPRKLNGRPVSTLV